MGDKTDKIKLEAKKKVLDEIIKKNTTALTPEEKNDLEALKSSKITAE